MVPMQRLESSVIAEKTKPSTVYGPRFVFVVMAGLLVLSIPFHLRPENFIVDDGYFYAQIARNIALSNGSTFNGVMPTNGYHPLWMLFCVACAFITKSSPWLAQILGLLQDGLVLGSAYLFTQICASSKKEAATAGIAVLAFMTMTLGTWRLVEADLALFLQTLVLYGIYAYKAHPAWTPTALAAFIGGGVLGLTLLARLDLIFFVLVVFGYVCWDCYGKQRGGFDRRWLTNTLQLAAGTCLPVCPYLFWNYRLFHHLEPISGAIKTTVNPLGLLHLPPFVIPFAICCLLNLLLIFKQGATPFDVVCVLTSIGALSHLIFTGSFGSMAAWYLTTACLGTAFCATWVLDLVLKRVRRPILFVTYGGSTLVLALLTLAGLRLVSNFSYTRLRLHNVSFGSGYVEPKKALAEKLKSVLPPGTRIYAFDAPGGVAFYSGMSIIPVDGVVGDYAYSEVLLSEGISEYTARERINYFIGPLLRQGQTYDRLFLRASRGEGGQTFDVQAPLTGKSAGLLKVKDTDLLFAFRMINPDLERMIPEVGVWRIRH